MGHPTGRPGTKKFPCPAVPLSRDKKSFFVSLSFCPGSKNIKKSKKFSIFFFFSKILCLFFSFCPVAVPGYCRMGRDRLSKSRPGLSHGKMSKFRPILVRPRTKCQNPAHPVKRFWPCPIVPLSWNNGGFHVVAKIIRELKSHMIPYKFKCSHFGKTSLHSECCNFKGSCDF